MIRLKMMFISLYLQRVVVKLAVAATAVAFGNLLEMQILRPHPELQKQPLKEVGPDDSDVHKSLRVQF